MKTVKIVITTVFCTIIGLFLLGLVFRLIYPEIALRGYRASEKRAHEEIRYLVD